MKQQMLPQNVVYQTHVRCVFARAYITSRGVSQVVLQGYDGASKATILLSGRVGRWLMKLAE